jgi:hypothetical protein
MKINLERKNSGNELRKLKQQVTDLESGLNIKEKGLITKNNYVSLL